jgi:hypothetical protein
MNNERRIEQFDPGPSWRWPSKDAKAAFHLKVSRQELEEKFGIKYTDPKGEWGDQPGPMLHALVNIDGVPVRLIEYVGEPPLEGITEVEFDAESPMTEHVLIEALNITPEQVEWRREEV